MSRGLSQIAAFAFVLALASDASAGSIFARALKVKLSRDLVKSVADVSDPHIIAADETAAGGTPREIIERRCGSIQEGYVDALKEANGLTSVNLDAPLGSINTPSKYPACLYVYDARERGQIEIRVEEGDNAAKIFTRLTGKPPTDLELEEYFGMPLHKLNTLQPGDILRPMYVTQPVWFTASGPNGSESAQLLSQEIDATAAASQVETAAGGIVIPIEAGRIATSGTNWHCVRNQKPLDGAAIERALIYSRTRGSSNTQANVLIVDNGFLGADRTSRFAGSPFDEDLFESDLDTQIARGYFLAGSRVPIFTRKVDGDPTIYGHGTHVAGLVLGGPEFPGQGRSKLPLLDQSLRLTVLNVADGSKTPFDGAEGILQNHIGSQVSWIVNMSLAYDGSGNSLRARNVLSTFQTLISERPKSFFVVAAGNDGKDAKSLRVYPAMLGGTRSENLVSVAALGGDGRITDFSNWGPTIDIAAPGCEIESWIGNTRQVARLSGTSQAAPLVTFVAALVSHLQPRSKPIDLKARLIASGTLLGPEDRPKTAFGVSLDATSAMYVYDDFVQTMGSESAYLGQIVRIVGLECPPGSGDSGPKPAEHLWAVKRAGAPLILFAGKDQDAIEEPCEGRVAPGAHVVIRPTSTVIAGATTNWVGPVELTIPIDDVANIVFASKQR